MSSIETKTREFHQIDEMARADRRVNQLHPSVKLFLVLFDLLAVLSVSKYDLRREILLVVWILFAYTFSEVPFRFAWKRVRYLLPLILLLGIANPFLDRRPLLSIGSVAVSGGMISMCTLFLKMLLTVLAGFWLIATTPMEDLCHALRLLHMPQILITELMLTFRYISLIAEEAGRITDAYALRAPGQKGIHIRAWGPLLGQLFLRSMDRAKAVYESMKLRGFYGEYPYTPKKRSQKADVPVFLSFGLLLLLLRFVL